MSKEKVNMTITLIFSKNCHFSRANNALILLKELTCQMQDLGKNVKIWNCPLLSKSINLQTVSKYSSDIQF